MVAVKSVKPYAGKEVLKVGYSEEEKSFFFSFLNMHTLYQTMHWKVVLFTISVLFFHNSLNFWPISLPFLFVKDGERPGRMTYAHFW